MSVNFKRTAFLGLFSIRYIFISKYMRIYWNNFIEELRTFMKAGIQIRDNSTNRSEETRNQNHGAALKPGAHPHAARSRFYFKKSVCMPQYPWGVWGHSNLLDLQSEFSVSFSGGCMSKRGDEQGGGIPGEQKEHSLALYVRHVGSFPTLQLFSNMINGQLLSHSGPCFPHLWNERLELHHLRQLHGVFFSFIFLRKNIEICQENCLYCYFAVI